MGKLYERPRSPFYWASYYDGEGRRVRVSTGTADKEEAKRFLKVHEGKVAEGAPLPPRADRVTFDQLRDNLMVHYETTGKWKDLEEAKRRIAHLTRYFGGRRASTISSPVIRAYAAQRLAAKVPHICDADTPHACRSVSPATINRELAMLRRMMRLGVKDRIIVSLPAVDMLRESAARAGFVDEAQYRTLARHLRPDLRVVVAIGYQLGWRARSEILTLERRQVDMSAGTLRLDAGATKNREPRVAYLPPELRTLLAEQLARVDTLQRQLGRVIPFVFPHLTGPHRGEHTAEFRKAWKQACKRAGLPGLLVHDLRRSAVRNMERGGVSRSVAMKITGHKTESVYRRYAIVSDVDLQDAATRIGTLAGTLAGFVGNGAR
jgi:integrase